MAAQLVQIENGHHRASVVESALSVWVARGWKLVTESDSQAEGDKSEGGESVQVEAEEADAGQKSTGERPETDKPAPAAPAAKPAGAHQAPELPTRS